MDTPQSPVRRSSARDVLDEAAVTLVFLTMTPSLLISVAQHFGEVLAELETDPEMKLHWYKQAMARLMLVLRQDPSLTEEAFHGVPTPDESPLPHCRSGSKWSDIARPSRRWTNAG